MDNHVYLCVPDGECEFCEERGDKKKKFLWRLPLTGVTEMVAENGERKGYFCSYGHFWEGDSRSKPTIKQEERGNEQSRTDKPRKKKDTNLGNEIELYAEDQKQFSLAGNEEPRTDKPRKKKDINLGNEDQISAA